MELATARGGLVLAAIAVWMNQTARVQETLRMVSARGPTKTRNRESAGLEVERRAQK
jgi:hypothetical protein